MSSKIPSWVPGGTFVLGDVKLADGYVPPSASLMPPSDDGGEGDGSGG